MFQSEDLAQYLNYKTRIELQLLNQQKGPNAGFFFTLLQALHLQNPPLSRSS